jgi:glycosyltransferase involved in cell wall biosynthesis/predicted SAM-dependent methyltransferase
MTNKNMTEYIIPFKQGDIIAELGGGERPIFHPNIDVRQLSTVDIVVDFNKTLPIPDNSYNGIFCKYLLEHLSWRRVKNFIREIFRILKPGGTAIFITANLLEQAKVLVNTPDWNENLINMIFGGQRFDENKEFDENWDQNAHHNGFSPNYITGLLKIIGFDVKITPIQTDVGPTDMIIEAKKPKPVISEITNNHINNPSHPFDRLYFEGGTYTGEGYRDFNVHYNTLKMILDKKPESVIDIGGARGYIVKKLNDLNIPATCIDISEHCYHTRATDNFVLHDLTKVPYPFKDKQFDLAVSISTLEHIQEDKIPHILKEIARISKRGFHGITFQTNPNDVDKTHINIKPIEWWKKAFEETLSIYPDYKYDILDKEDTERGIPTIPTNQDNLVKLNIGSFINMFHYSWQNIDIIDLTDFARQNGYIFKKIDVTNPLPYNNNSVDLIVSSHFLEHLYRDKGKKFLLECLRVLKPNGILRLSIPDTELLIKKYLDNTIDQYKYVNIGVENSTDNSQSLFELLLSGHCTTYDYDSISKLLSQTGFTNIKRMVFNKSSSKEIEKQTIDMYPTISLYVEAIKPAEVNIEANNITNKIENIKEKNISKETKGPIITTWSITTKEKLKIALISTPFFTVPPIQYGGLEQIVFDLAEALDELGHHITIFAPEGSKPTKNGELITTGPSINSVNVDWFNSEKNAYEIYKQYIIPEKFDIIHGHDWFGFEYLLKMNNPRLKIIHTHHGGMNWESPPPVKYPNLVTLSQHMKNYTETYIKSLGYNISTQYVHNGINLNKYSFDSNIKRTNRLLYVGRFSKFKGAHIAIEVAKKANLSIDLIGGTFIDDVNYLKEIESMCNGDTIVIYKDANHDFKIKKMQEAKALIVPSNMNEPFGLTCIEGMACGTPIIATRDGAIPEIVVHGETGFICDTDVSKNTEEQMIEYIKNLDKIDPLKCRKHAEDNFSRITMSKNYIKLYQRILNNDEW